jgi:hypothetical protein
VTPQNQTLSILIDRAKRIRHLHVRVAVEKGGTSNPLGVLRDLIDGVSV